MSWLAQRTLDLAHAVSQFYYSRKYRALAHHLGRPALARTPTSPGLIVIQFDGLSYPHLQQALAQGYLPHLRRALEEESLSLAAWRCGVPSTTPAVQAGILYGDNFDIPGFRWYEKDRGVAIVCKRPDHLYRLSQRLARAGRGLLRGGSSYTNLLDGEADLAVFTVSALGSTFFDNVRGLGFASLFLLSPGRVGRVMIRSLREYVRYWWHRLAGLVTPQVAPLLGRRSPLLHIILDIAIAEIQTFGVMLDIYRGVPVIYVTYSGYDDAAHHYGPTHPEAMRVLRWIDAYIHQIDRMRRQYRRAWYDLYILSDHGMSDALPFETLYGRTLGQWLLESIGEPLVLDERTGAEQQPATRTQYVLEEFQALEARRSVRGALLARRVRELLERRTPGDPELGELDVERRGDIAVYASGGLAHVYFNVAPRALTLSEITVLYPALLSRLIEHPGLGLIVGRDRCGGTDETVMLGRHGTRTHINQQVVITGVDPLASVPEAEACAEDLVRLAGFPHSGDLILLGAWRADGRVVTFEQQAGTHGGLGGPQNEAFIIGPQAEWLNSPPKGPLALHAHLAQRYS